ncbi:MAG: LysR substrate-binding domain-containing protein [Paracoccaceae bacterium]
MNLKVRQLEIFKTVMEWGSVSRAAERLNCTQPTVSIALANLESEIGLALFDRTGGQLVPTQEARSLFDEVEQSLVSLERVKDRITVLKSGGAGHLRVACLGAPIVHLLPEAMALFTASHPDAQVELLTRSSFQVAQWVENRQIDIGMVEQHLARQSSVACQIDLPCVCLMPAGHPLTEKSAVSITDIAAHRLIGVLKGHQIDEALDRAAAADGLTLSRVTYGYLFVTMRQLVARGTGLAVVDASNAVAKLGDGVVWRPLLPEIRYAVSVVRPSGVKPNALTDAFISCIEEAGQRVAAEYDAALAASGL